MARTLETLLGRRWILKARDRELYYQMRDEIGTVRKFLKEKLGYQVIVNQYLVKVEKLPAKPENWMGILEFSEPLQYVFFCLVLMFLEDKDAEEQFVLSELTEFVQAQCRSEQIDWTVYTYRRHLIRVLKYCVSCGILNVDDGSEESFAREYTGEVLYENTGASRYFMRNFTQDIMGYTNPEDFEQEEWIDIDEDRGIVRRQRVYRRLLMSMGMYRTEETEEDFAYLRNKRNLLQDELDELLDCTLEVHRNGAFLILGEGCRMGRCFPEEHTLSDIALLVNQLIVSQIESGKLAVPPDEQIHMPKEAFRALLGECRERFGKGFIKSYREMTSAEFCRTVWAYLTELELITEHRDDVEIRMAAGKVIGRYPEEFEAQI